MRPDNPNAPPIKFSYSNGIYKVYEEIPTTKSVTIASFRSLEDAMKMSSKFPDTCIKEV